MTRTAAALALALLVTAGGASATARTRCPAGTGFAHLAYVKAGALITVDMPACSSRVLVARGAAEPVRWSADGRYVSFGGGVVSADDRRLFRGLRGVWSPRGHTLATLTDAGGVVLGGPGAPSRRLLENGFGARSVAFDPTGTRLRGVRPLQARTPPRQLGEPRRASVARRRCPRRSRAPCRRRRSVVRRVSVRLR